MINITGAAEGRIAPIAAKIIKERKGQSLIVVSTYNRARRLAADLYFFTGRNAYILPPDDETFVQYEARNNDELMERLRILCAVSGEDECTVIAPVTGAIKKLPPKESFTENRLTIKTGDDLSLEDTARRLSFMGYERVNMTEARGEYSIRGEIIDVFPPDSDLPCRIELFDTEVDSIRAFDPDSQRSAGALSQVSIYQCTQIVKDEELFRRARKKIDSAYEAQIRKLEKKEGNSERVHNLRQRRDQLLEYTESMINIQYLEKFINYFYEDTMYIWDYMNDPLVFVDDPARILETLDLYEKERADDMEMLLGDGRAIGDDFRALSGKTDFFGIYQKEGYIFTPFAGTIKNAPPLKKLINVNSRTTPVFNGRMDILSDELKSYVRRGYDVTVVCGSSEREESMKDFLAREELLGEGIRQGRRYNGRYEFPDEKICYIWEGDIFGGRRRSKRRRKKSKGQQIKSFADVQTGDYVVHESHGIGKFMGIEQLTVQGVKKDYLKVKYAERIRCTYLLISWGCSRNTLAEKAWCQSSTSFPGNEWKSAKAKARAAVDDMAEELIKVSAARMSEKGYAFSKDTVWQAEFESSFPYTETEDQLRCTEEIKKDMESDVPMDRLLCGDVGFGKTEVAARALFKCVSDGKQAAVLVPTTLLANQHYYTHEGQIRKIPF